MCVAVSWVDVVIVTLIRVSMISVKVNFTVTFTQTAVAIVTVATTERHWHYIRVFEDQKTLKNCSEEITQENSVHWTSHPVKSTLKNSILI